MVDVDLTCKNYFNVIHPIVLIIRKLIVSVKHNIYLLVLFTNIHCFQQLLQDFKQTTAKLQEFSQSFNQYFVYPQHVKY